MDHSDFHEFDEVGIYKGFRVHRDSLGRLFLLKKRIRHYLDESKIKHVKYLDAEHMNQLPKGENIFKIKLVPKEPVKTHKHEEEYKKVGIFNREGELKGKEVFTGVYGGLFMFNNDQKIRLKDSDRKYIENINKDFNQKEQIGVYIGKGKKHGHTVFKGKLGALYCLINEKENSVNENEKKLISNFQKVKTKKNLSRKKENDDDEDSQADSKDDSDSRDSQTDSEDDSDSRDSQADSEDDSDSQDSQESQENNLNDSEEYENENSDYDSPIKSSDYKKSHRQNRK